MNTAQNKMFSIKGLTVTATSEQIDAYASDSTEYDCIKYALERIAKLSHQKHTENTVQAAHIKSCLYLLLVTDTKNETSFIIYNSKNKTIIQEIPVNDLKNVKNELDQDIIIRQLTLNRTNILPEQIKEQALETHKKRCIKEVPILNLIDKSHDNEMYYKT